MKFTEAKVVFAEVPDEITLAINISGCPIECPDCHSKYLWDDVGETLDRDSLYSLIENNKGITCVAFMGGDANPIYLNHLISLVKEKYPNLKTVRYSGQEGNRIKMSNMKFLDYLKVGPFIKEKGGLDCKTTNQRMYKINHLQDGKIKFEDITYKFYKHENNN